MRSRTVSLSLISMVSRFMIRCIFGTWDSQRREVGSHYSLKIKKQGSTALLAVKKKPCFYFIFRLEIKPKF